VKRFIGIAGQFSRYVAAGGIAFAIDFAIPVVPRGAPFGPASQRPSVTR